MSKLVFPDHSVKGLESLKTGEFPSLGFWQNRCYLLPYITALHLFSKFLPVLTYILLQSGMTQSRISSIFCMYTQPVFAFSLTRVNAYTATKANEQLKYRAAILLIFPESSQASSMLSMQQTNHSVLYKDIPTYITKPPSPQRH